MFILHPFCFLSLEHHLGFIKVYLSIPLVFHHWDSFLGSIYPHSFFPFVTNHCDMILWFRIVLTPSRFDGCLFFLNFVSHFWTTSEVLSKVIHSLLWFVIMGTPPRRYLSLIVCSFNFSSFRPHPSFCQCLFFIPFVSYHWNAICILPKFIYLFYSFFVIGTAF